MFEALFWVPELCSRAGTQNGRELLEPGPVEGAERVPKWFQNGPQMVPKVAWKATGGQLVRLMWTRLPLKRALEEHRKKN